MGLENVRLGLAAETGGVEVLGTAVVAVVADTDAAAAAAVAAAAAAAAADDDDDDDGESLGWSHRGHEGSHDLLVGEWTLD